MKKRILAFFCALTLCLGVLISPLPVGAAGDPCFMAVNDTLLTLEDRYTPIAVDGQYYVPYTVLDSSVTGLALGVFPIYNASLNTLTIYNRERAIKFDLSTGLCTDSSGVNSTLRVVTRNGRIYVPARVICEYFGLTYSSRLTTYGPMVRIRSSSAVLDDDTFVGCAQMQMEDRLREWRKAQAELEAPTAAVTPEPTPGPSPTPAPEDVDKSGVHTYLAFRADQPDGLEELLATLEKYRVQALFFFPAQELADYDDAVRSVLCGGHAVGLLVSGASAEEAVSQAAEGNRLLAGIAHLNTNTVLAPAAEDAAARSGIENAGLLCWKTTVDARPDGRGASSQASAVWRSVDQYRHEVYILSDTSAAGAALTERLLPKLIQDRYDLRLAVETEL